MDRLPEGFPPFFGKLLWLMHTDGDIHVVEERLREHGFLREGVSVDQDALHAFLAPLAEPSQVESFKFSREWMRSQATRVTEMRSANVGRRLNLPPSYILIHRVSTAGIGVLCQLECEGPFRAEVLRWMPGYADPASQPGQIGRGSAPIADESRVPIAASRAPIAAESQVPITAENRAPITAESSGPDHRRESAQIAADDQDQLRPEPAGPHA